MLERVQERVQEGHPRAHRPVQERALAVQAPERVQELVLEVHQQALGPVQEPAPGARGQPAARARAEQVAPQEVLLVAGACPASALPDRRLRHLATPGLRQAASRRAWVMPLRQLPLSAKDFLRLNGRRLSTANVN